MNWDTQLNSILTATDSNVAKIKQRLNTTSISSKVDLLLDRINTEKVAFDESLAGSQHSCPTCLSLPHCRMATEELAAISSQLHSQAKVIESLTQSVNRLKQEKEFQQQQIHHLEEEVGRLHNSPQSGLESLLGRRMEGLKSELRNLRQQVFHQPDGDCTPDLYPSSSVMQEVHESKKLLWREYECVRREVEQLKHKLNRQEEDLVNQMSETDEMKRTQSRYCKMLEDLMISHKTQSDDLDKARLETRSTQEELGHIKSTVTDLKDQMKNLPLEEKSYTKPVEKESAYGMESNNVLREEETFSSSLSDDSASELSLTDVSSDELSSATEIKEPEGSKDLSTPSLELEDSTPKEEAGSMSDEDLSSDLFDSLPELNLSDL
ncbi:spindle pole body component 110-like isoform X1 [Gopherus evgoodei]|uniref:Spindle pole body component 110-like n=1 Tax=Gopherus evgoodei TaxID=1825980 RepID=A0A8C4W844_9SAUR|nr:spindle pole body component 110-like isoform X1 [Gopherus evgoodei]XP_030428772.1 spindle pole body component 110-like isoform X1 [Gopherus evgoodei]